MKTSLKITALLGSLVIAATSAFGIQINGSIAFEGSLELDQSISSSPTEFVTFSSVAVATGTQSGAYLGTGGTTGVTLTPFSFGSFPGSIAPLWSFSLGLTDYSFDLTALTSVSVTNLGSGLYQLAVAGTGMAYITGYDATPGAFSITTTGNSSSTQLGLGAFTFVTADREVPDTGSTAILLGAALLGFVTVSRKVKRKN